MRKGLTEQNVATIPFARKRRTIADRNCKGLELRIGASSLVFSCYIPGVETDRERFTICEYVKPERPSEVDPNNPPEGSYTWAATECRRIKSNARNWRIGVDGAEHPRLERERHNAERQAAIPREELAESWFAKYKQVDAHKARKTAFEVNRTIERDAIPIIRELRVPDITEDHIDAIINPIADRGKTVQARRTRTHTLHFLNWARSRQRPRLPPMPHKADIRREKKRKRRRLDNSEIGRFWRACDELGRYGDVLKVLLLTGARKSEVTGMRWDEIDFDRAIWTCPEYRQKNEQEKTLPLPSPVVEIIRSQARIGDSPLVFAGPNGIELSNWSRLMTRLNKLAGFDWERDDFKIGSRLRIHDLRRTARSGFDDLEINFIVSEAIMGHRIGDDAARTYQVSDLVTLKRDAINRWSKHIEKLLHE